MTPMLWKDFVTITAGTKNWIFINICVEKNNLHSGKIFRDKEIHRWDFN